MTLPDKVTTVEAALTAMHSGDTMMIGSFLGVGCPVTLVEAIATSDLCDLEIVNTATDFPNKFLGRLYHEGKVRKATASWIGWNAETVDQYRDGSLKVEFVPIAIIAERARAAGAGLGGFLSPVGVGTLVERGKDVITRNGKRYILEEPLSADVCIVRCHVADRWGNLVYRRTARHFHPTFATAATTVIAEAEHIVEVGELDPELVETPGIFVDHVVQAAPR
jgi:acetate CoA/acetoacetate CoA-transferase alpha subunit